MCPRCAYQFPQRRGVRRSKIKYFCKSCGKWFQINRGKNINWARLTLKHLSGVSFRSLADQYQLGLGTVYRHCHQILESLPYCADVTRKYATKFCGILLVDGKFIKIKGYGRKIPVIYGIDYLTHDIPHFVLSVSENYLTCLKFFQALRLLNYPLQSLVCDDNINIRQAAQAVYPKVVIQLCHNHYKQNIRASLGFSQNKAHLPFVRQIEKLLGKKMGRQEFQSLSRKILNHYRHQEEYVTILVDIFRRLPQLTGYMRVPRTPRTNNLIECFNSHLNGRLKTIKGFKSFKYGKLWLNGYFLRRRTKKFTDCRGKFKRLNGKTSLSQSKNQRIDEPIFF